MSYSDLLTHESMVFDEVRNRAYLAAMREVITPESTVLDVGAGVGVLGLLAARLGARKVYCVEPTPVADHISTLARANGVAERMVILRGRIEEVELPESVDVMTSVFTGTLLFNECLLPSLYRARDRFLKPGGVMLPDRARLLFAAVEAPSEYTETVASYQRTSLGIDYSSIASGAANRLYKIARKGTTASLLSEPVTAASLDLTTTYEDRVQWKCDVEMTRDGMLHGVLGWIEIRLGDHWLSSALDQPEVHWQPILLPIASPVSVVRGERVALAFQFIDDMQTFWSVGAKGVLHRQSPIKDNQDAAIQLMLASPMCTSPLGQEGMLLEQILSSFRQGRSNMAIVDHLLTTMPMRFPGKREALAFVGALSARYRVHPARNR